MTHFKSDFPLLANSNVAYLDNAATSQKPQCVLDALTHYYGTSNANVHRGLYSLAEAATIAYETTRDDVRKFINAASRKEIIFTSGSTVSINLVAHSFGEKYIKAGDVILLSPSEHHSNIVPWQLLAKRTGASLEWFDLTSDGIIDSSTLANRIHPHVKFISVAHIANASGTVNPIEQIISLAKQHNIPILIDAAQSVPHRTMDVQQLGCDFLVFSGHKMCGPTGVGVLYGQRKWLEDMPPFMGGGEMIAEVYPDYSTWAELPFKFEAGTPNIAGVVGLGAAINYLNTIGMKNVQLATDEIYRYAYTQLQALDFVQILGETDLTRRSGIISFTMTGVHPHDIAQVLDQRNVAVRAGHHCAQLLMKHWQVPATTRVSIYFYNTTDDINQLITGLHDVVKKFTK